MILSFKPQFKEPILIGSKIHTIREDKNNRWSVGKIIHFATGVRTKAYEQFDEGACKGVQVIEIEEMIMCAAEYCFVHKFIDPKSNIKHFKTFCVKIDNRKLSTDEIKALAKNDGFADANKFFEWFNCNFKGKIIHWTDFRY